MSKKTKKQEIDYKKIAIILLVVILVIILIAFIQNKIKNNKELKLDEFEKTAVYGYLEENVLDVFTLYQLSGKSEFDEIQIFQSKLKQALDQYFAGRTETSVKTDIILGMIDEKYVPESVDFHGILVSDYEFSPENDTFIKSIGAYPGMSNIETDINGTDYSNKKADIQKIEIQEKNKYKVTFNIIDNMMLENSIIDSSGEAIVLFKEGNIKIESCNINK